MIRPLAPAPLALRHPPSSTLSAAAPSARPRAVPRTGAKPQDTLARFDQLSATERGLLGKDGAKVWSRLSRDQKAVFLLLTRRLEANGFDLQGLTLQSPEDTLRRNRLLFAPGPALDRFEAQLREGVAEKRLLRDDPFDLFHWGMARVGARETRSTWSMQMGVGPAGAFVDVDRYNPWTGWRTWLGHAAEILVPGKPSPFEIARELGVSLGPAPRPARRAA